MAAREWRADPADRDFFDLFQQTAEFGPRDREYDAYLSFNMRAVERGRSVVALLRRFRPVDGVAALDIGCGSGGLAIALAESGARVSAVEPDPTRRAWAEARIRGHRESVELMAGTAERLDFPDDSFDVVTLDSVIEHVEDPAATIREVCRVLRPGGIVYLVWPNRLSLINVLHDPHYQMLFVVLMPRKLGKFYVERVRRVQRGYWVNRIPTSRSLSRRFAQYGVDLQILEPEGIQKIANPATIRRHKWIRRLALTAAHLGLSRALRRLAVAQHPTHTAIARKRPTHR
jgi:ubiquinone/menaquinone biosynthesis C-methylase UbiE